MSQSTWASLKPLRKLASSIIAFAFLCIAASAAICVFALHCVGCQSAYVTLLWILAAALFATGLLVIPIIFCSKRKHLNTTSQAVISSIPAEDFQESPTPILHYNHVRRHLPFIETSSTDSLPDYFTVVQNPDVYLSMDDTGGRLEDVPESPPPCYEHALRMTTYAV